MGTSAYSHLRYDLNNYIVELQRVATIAASFIIKDSIIRNEYLRDIDASVRDYQSRFDAEMNPQKKMEIIEELKAELKLTQREYQMLRMKDRVIYAVTDVFEEHGVLKYAKIAGGVVGGGLEAWGGYRLTKLGKSLNLKAMRGVGLMLVAHGTNNVYESVSPLIYEHNEAGVLRKIYREAAKIAGFDDDAGDLAYSGVELSLTLYAAIRTPVLSQNPNRLVLKYLGEQPGTGKLFRHVSNDFISKWASKNAAMKLYFTGSTVYKFKAEFIDGGYKFDD
ncbi:MULTISPECIES: DUF4225 domain-containing protein [Kosakonia]|uniref:DUF4225 domain-containing protein n=1 Tax=Kosakonia pseudosacchari TaxID=1646340 RepID=A0ABX4IU66_9ENTR|nr:MULTISPECIES: DUF4225 domain-containing protein [Kosakonia]PDO89044.1 hypothetical protein BK796_03600 [Kosakonia pseudosacchari]